MIRLIHFFHCLIKKYNKYRRLGAVYCSAVWRAREQLLSALYRGNYWGRAGLGRAMGCLRPEVQRRSPEAEI